MFVVIAVLIGLIIGFIRGGSVGSIFNHLYKKWYLGFIGAILLILLHYSFLVQPIVIPLQQYLPIVNFVAYILVLLMLIFNLDDFFSISMSVGVTLNFIVTFINSGYMPVSDAVLSQIPINYPLAQSIYTGMNAVYALMQPQTLLSFLGVFIPIPILSSFIALVGSLPGFSIGDVLILIGIAGVIQSAMVLSKNEPQIVSIKEEKPERVRRKANPVTTQKRPEHFGSRTEELFFEDTVLPEDPLDKIFGREPEQPTKIIEDLSDVRPVNTGSYQLSDDTLSVDDLTKPLGTGIINSREVERKIREQQEQEIPLEPLSEDEGFFASSYLNGRNGTGEVTTDEIFRDTNVVEDVRFVTNEVEIQTAEIVVDEGEKPVYKPTQEKLERERQSAPKPAIPENVEEQVPGIVPVSPVFYIEPETQPVEEKQEVRKGLIDKTPIPKAAEQSVKPEPVQASKEQVVTAPEPVKQEQIVVTPEVKVSKQEKTEVKAPETKIEKPVTPVTKTQEKETPEVSEQAVTEVKKPVEKKQKPAKAAPKQQVKTEVVAEPQEVEVQKPVKEEVKPEPVETVVETKPTKKFGLGPGNFLYLSSNLKPTKKFVPDESLVEEEVVSEPTQEQPVVNDIFFDYDQYQLLLNSIKDVGLREELEKTFRNYSKKKLNERKASATAAQTKEPTKAEVSKPKKKEPTKAEVSKPVKKETAKVKVSKPERKEPAKVEVSKPVKKETVKVEVSKPERKEPAKVKVSKPEKKEPTKVEVSKPERKEIAEAKVSKSEKKEPTKVEVLKPEEKEAAKVETPKAETTQEVKPKELRKEIPETVVAETEETETKEEKVSKIEEIYTGGPTSSIKEHDEQLKEEISKEEPETADEEEITDIINDTNEVPKLKDLLLKEKTASEVESTNEEEITDEVQEVVETGEEAEEITKEEVAEEAQEPVETEIGEEVEETAVEPEETLQESENKEVLLTPVETNETLEEETEEVEEASEEEPVEFLPVIDWNSFANLILEDDKELKRGSYVQGNDGGYFVNKAYKEERSKMDKSEERMMNVWSNLSKENQQRKLERRKQATGSYFSQAERDKPSRRERVVESEVEEIKEVEKPEASFKAAPMSETQRVNQMTDEEREKAGYEKVTINFQGNEISFWQKKVSE